MPHLAHQKHLKHDNKNKNHTLITRLVMIMAIVEPLMALPQAYGIWVHHVTAGVSIITWSFFTIAAFTWLLYGLQIKSTPLIVTSCLWILVEGSVVLGLIIY